MVGKMPNVTWLEGSFVDLIGFRASDNAARLILILREFFPIKVGQERFSPRGDDCHNEMG